MPNFRRNYVPGGSYFFTVVTERRAPILCREPASQILRSCLRRCRDRWLFSIEAIVLLPDHLHTIWVLPPGDDRFSLRWGWIKKEFTKAWLGSGGEEQPATNGRIRDGRRGVLQPKFWEHTLRDERDFERHFDYIHFNPVRHGIVQSPGDWEFSSFHRWVRLGVYPEDWASPTDRSDERSWEFDDLETSAME
jgi:putative transposase